MSGTRQRYIAAIRDAVEAAHGVPMRYGVDDCLLWVANIDRCVTGVDPAKAQRGTYRSRNGAIRIMGQRGTLGMMQAAARRCGWKPIKVYRARPGDRGLVMMPTGLCGVIFDGAFWIGRSDCGVTGTRGSIKRRPIVLRAWSIARS